MQKLIIVGGVALLAACFATTSAQAATPSAYAQLSGDLPVRGKVEALSQEIVLPAPADVLVSSDGRYFPSGGSIADVYVTIDGHKATNDSTTDWRGSTNPQQHAYDTVGAERLAPGRHRVALVAEAPAGTIVLGAASNLAIMVRPAGTVNALSLARDQGPFEFSTAGLSAGRPAPQRALLSADVAGGDVVALASASGTTAAHSGDAMIGISLDGRNPGNDKSMWSVQDLCACAEPGGPLFSHAFLAGLQGRHQVSLVASEFPWMSGEDPASYGIASGARLVLLQGSMAVRGAAPTSAAVDNWWDYTGVGTSEGWPGVPAVGTHVPLASAAVDVPAGHDGVVMFLAKTRVQGDSSDVGGTAGLRLTLDGRPVGSVGVQQLATPDGESQRTLSASYLAAGAGALTPGRHVVTVYGRADGRFKHLAMLKDLDLLWFDDAMPIAGAPVPTPAPAPAPAPAAGSGTCGGRSSRKGVRVARARYTLRVPRRCAPGQRLRATLRVARRGRVRVRRVAFRLAGGKARIDRHAPFRRTLRLPAAAPRGCRVPLRVRIAVRTHGQTRLSRVARTHVRLC